METVLKKELTYNDHLKLIESEEKVIADLDNDIEAVESELEDVELSIDLAEAARLNKIKSVYEGLVTTREAKEAKLEELEATLDERRGYLNSLREDNYVDSEDEVREDQDSLESSVDSHIEKENSLDFLDDWEAPIKSDDGVYKIDNTKEAKEATEFIN